MNEFPGYDPTHEQLMRGFSRSLPEDHRRRYAAVEAQKIGYGGVAYVARVLGMSRATIYTALRELEELDEENPQHRCGLVGGGRLSPACLAQGNRHWFGCNRSETP